MEQINSNLLNKVLTIPCQIRFSPRLIPTIGGLGILSFKSHRPKVAEPLSWFSIGLEQLWSMILMNWLTHSEVTLMLLSTMGSLRLLFWTINWKDMIVN